LGLLLAVARLGSTHIPSVKTLASGEVPPGNVEQDRDMSELGNTAGNKIFWLSCLRMENWHLPWAGGMLLPQGGLLKKWKYSAGCRLFF
jgi:hypothetical protein